LRKTEKATEEPDLKTNAVPALHEISDSDEIFPIDSISSIKLHDH
jgi:hypothetical protein